jgi:hypothetical protein
MLHNDTVKSAVQFVVNGDTTYVCDGKFPEEMQLM